MENIFTLIQIRIKSETGKIRHPHSPVAENTIGRYCNLDSAITAMREFVATEKNRCTYCFYISEYDFEPKNIEKVTERCYTKLGDLYDQYLESPNAIFRGRKPKNIRFKEGDIVEVLQYESISLERISYAPLSKEQYMERCKRIRRNYGETEPVHYLDRSDDCYTTHSLIDLMNDFEGAHTHAYPIIVFPLSKPVSAKHRKAFIEKYTEYINGEEFQ